MCAVECNEGDAAMSGDHNMYQKPSIKVDGVDLVAAVETLKRLLLQAQKKEWQGLTDEEIADMHHEIKVKGMGAYKTEDIYRAIEAKLKEKNND